MKCFVEGCTEDDAKDHSDRVTFHRFPRNPKAAVEWANICQPKADTWKEEDVSKFWSSRKRICSRHFGEQEFPHLEAKRIRHGAFPKKFLPASKATYYCAKTARRRRPVTGKRNMQQQRFPYFTDEIFDPKTTTRVDGKLVTMDDPILTETMGACFMDLMDAVLNDRLNDEVISRVTGLEELSAPLCEVD